MAQEAGSFPPGGGADHQSAEGVEASTFAQDMTMREQVMDIIDAILADSDPKSEGPRNKLRQLIEARPDDPEGALLEHLLETRKASVSEPAVPVRQEVSSVHLESSDAARTVTVPVSQEVREDIQAILADGARVIVECGPGRVLTGLNRRIERNKDIAMLAIEDAESLQQALQACRSNA